MMDRMGEKLERWLAHESGPGDEHFEREVLMDSHLSDEVYGALELHDALSEAAAEGVPENNPSPVLLQKRWAWTTGLVAALLAFIILIPQFQKPDGDLSPRLRSAGDAGAVAGTAPRGEVTHFPRIFHWRPAPERPDARYRWELYDAQSRKRAVAVVSDTVLVREGGITPADSLGTWLWLVVELKPNGLEGPTSAAVQFTVKAKRTK